MKTIVNLVNLVEKTLFMAAAQNERKYTYI